MRGRRWTGWVHVFVLALVLPLAGSSALPIVAHWLGDTAAHVCPCSRGPGHATCGCPVCEHRADLRSRVATIRGKCGEGDQAFGGALALAVPAPGVVGLESPRAMPASVSIGPRAPARVFVTPPTPPPRAFA